MSPPGARYMLHRAMINPCAGSLLLLVAGHLCGACSSGKDAPAPSASVRPSASVQASVAPQTSAPPPPTPSAAPFVAPTETPEDVRAIARRRSVDDGKIPPSDLAEYRCGDLDCMVISNGYTSDRWCFRNGQVVGRAHGTDYGEGNSAGGELPDLGTCTRKPPTKQR